MTAWKASLNVRMTGKGLSMKLKGHFSQAAPGSHARPARRPWNKLREGRRPGLCENSSRSCHSERSEESRLESTRLARFLVTFGSSEWHATRVFTQTCPPRRAPCVAVLDAPATASTRELSWNFLRVDGDSFVWPCPM